MADVSGKFFSAKKVRTGVSPSSPGIEQGETLPPVNPPGTSLNSVGLTMPSAFAVANSPLTSNGTIAVTGAGTVAQYVRGDGTLADFPESSGGGSSVSYYLNGSVSQGTIGGVAYLEMNKVPILGAGTDFTRNSNGYIASFITDAGDPNLLEIPGGNWNFESYFSASSGGGSPTFYVELYKVNAGGTATLIASNSANPELISFGTTIAPYFSSLAVPTTVLALTDRLAVRYYVNPEGRTLTLHTEGPHLCQIITTFTTGITALNGLTAQVQFFAVGTSGTDFNIASATATHTFNLPTASATNRGALSSTDWSVFNSKIGGSGTSGQVAYFNGTSSITGESNLFWDSTNDRLGIGTATINHRLQVAPLATFGNAEDGNICISTIPSGGTSTSPTTTGGIIFGDNTVTNSYLGRIAVIQDNPSASTASHMRFYTNSAGGNGSTIERTRIFSDGNVLIQSGGTFTNAGFRLDVNGTGRFSGSLTTGADITLSAANPFVYGGTAAGSVGLSNIGGQTYVRVFGASHATTPNITQFVNAGSTSLTLASTGAATFSSSVTASNFFASAGNNATIFSSTAATTGYQTINLANSGAQLAMGINNSTGSFLTNSLAYASFITTGLGSTPLQLGTNSTMRMTINSVGNVLIGTTTTPTAVSGVSFPLTLSSSAATRLRIDSTNASPNSGVGLYANGVQKFSFAMYGATSDFTIYNDALLAPSLTVKGTNSNVLIGTTDDTSDKLRVNGNTFTNTLMTWNPQNDNRSGVEWRFGAATIGTDTPNRRLRVSVGGMEYYIAAVEV